MTLIQDKEALRHMLEEIANSKVDMDGATILASLFKRKADGSLTATEDGEQLDENTFAMQLFSEPPDDPGVAMLLGSIHYFFDKFTGENTKRGTLTTIRWIGSMDSILFAESFAMKAKGLVALTMFYQNTL